MTAERPTSAIGVDLGGTQLRAGRVEAGGRRLATRREPTPGGGPDAVVAAILRLVGDLRDDTCAAIGVGVPGAIEAVTGRVLNIPALPGWRDVALAPRLAAAAGLPCRLENDAKAAAMGEWRAGAGHGCDNFVMVMIGTGIGGAAVVDGRLLRGAGGLAGEIGHTRITDAPTPCACGGTGCWQSLASGTALDRRAAAAASDDPQGLIGRLAGARAATGAHLAAAAAEGDAVALGLLDGHARAIGLGFANLHHVYAPERIVVGGGVSSLLDAMRGTLDRVLRDALLPGFGVAAILRADLGDDAGLVGAALAALESGGSA